MTGEGEAVGIEMVAEDFPHGLRCAECSREIRPGERYSEKLDEFIDDTPSVVLVCVPCALAVAG